MLPVHRLQFTLTAALASASLLGTAACKGGESASASSTEGASETATTKAEPKRPPSVRTKLEPFRPLLAESARAELDVGGLLIDFGTADQHKFTRGGWRTGWGPSKQEGGVSYAAVDARKSDLNVYLPDEPVAEVVLRARSATAGQVLTIYADGERVADGKLEADWSVVRIPTAGLEPGRHEIDLVFSKGGNPRAEIDWMWFAQTAGAKEPGVVPRVLPVKVGERPMRALIAPSARSYSFYLQPREGASLVVDYGSDKGATFKVVATTDGGEDVELWSGKGEASWKEAKVDLSKVAGKAVRLSLVTEGAEGVAGWGEPEIMLEPSGRKAPTGAAPKNVIVLLIDTVRADVFQAYNADSKVIAPHFDELAKKSTVFVNAYSQENWTKPAVATVLSGTYPTTHDTKTDGASLPKEVEILSEKLKGSGFKTAGFVANGYVSEKFGFQKGWDVFKNYIRESIPSEAEYVYADALDWVKKNKDQKFFLYLQTIDPHVVYRVDEPYTSHYFEGQYSGPLGPTIAAEEQIALGKGSMKHGQRDIDWLKALYYGEVTYHDEHMGKFLAELEKMGLMEDTLFIVTNDHGEELGEHGKYGHGHTLFDELIRAPMLIHYPKLFPAEQRTEVVENVDLAPTILDVLGQKPLENADGSSLLPLVQGEPVQRPYYAISEFLEGRRAARVGNYKMVDAAGNTTWLYDVVSDPGETKDLAATAPIARRMVEVYMGEGLAAPDKSQRLEDIAQVRQFEAGKADIDPEMRKQLEALGYFGE